MKTTVRRNPYIVFGAFLLVFSLLMAAGKTGDLLLRGLIWVVVLATSAAVVIQRLRGAKPTWSSRADTLLKRWRQWITDDSDQD